jgi:hypothetical protein
LEDQAHIEKPSMLGAIEAELKLMIAGNHDRDLNRYWFEFHFDEKNTIRMVVLKHWRR